MTWTRWCEGRTALICSVERGPKAMLTTLVNAGADVNKGKDNGVTPLHAAACAYPLKADKLTALVGLGADVNRADCAGWTPLHMAVKCNEVDGTRMLIAAGAIVNTMDMYGATPLDTAVGNEYVDQTLVAALKAAGATHSDGFQLPNFDDDEHSASPRVNETRRREHYKRYLML